ncbi:unnamed protein product, partial [Hymenolepis diminuta]
KVIVSRNVAQFSFTWFEDFCRCLKICLSRPPPTSSGRNEQLVGNMKGQLLMSQGEEGVEEILNSLYFRYRTTLHVGV